LTLKHLKQSRNDLFASIDRPALKGPNCGDRFSQRQQKHSGVLIQVARAPIRAFPHRNSELPSLAKKNWITASCLYKFA
jgi:hypothetical protein